MPATERAVAPSRRDGGRVRARRTGPVRARALGVPPPRPAGRPASAHPAARDRAARRAGARHGARSVTRPVVCADLGTGSGAIGLSLVAELPLDGTTVWLTDVSTDALDVARANAPASGRRSVNVRFGAGLVVRGAAAGLRGGLHVVVANPPYIADDDPDGRARCPRPRTATRAVRRCATVWTAIRQIAADVGSWLAPGGVLLLEIGHRQGAAVADLLLAAGLVDVTVDATSPAATASPSPTVSSAASRRIRHAERITAPHRRSCCAQQATPSLETPGSVEPGGHLSEQRLLGRVDGVVDAGHVAGGREQGVTQHGAGDAVVDVVEQRVDWCRRRRAHGPWRSPGRGTGRTRTCRSRNPTPR